mmetsp:Transcript_33515/g.107025  ORF Transcript_33515/g.107025 Transcript_33515/m.107025 type:complete len:920 (+) Transcript_33515:70-2829(+)
MLPFQLEAPAGSMMTPGEAALRQRQRMLQMGVFVCCLLLLLDTRAPPHPYKGGSERKEDAARQEVERLTANVDAVLSVEEAPHTNVSGYYHGEWSRYVFNATESDIYVTESEKGTVDMHLDMFSVMPSVSVVRGLLVMSADEASEKFDDASVAAFGVYLQNYGRLALVANVGNPYADIELRWTLKTTTTTTKGGEGDASLREAEARVKSAKAAYEAAEADRRKVAWFAQSRSNGTDDELKQQRHVRRRGEPPPSPRGETSYAQNSRGGARFLLRRGFGLPLGEHEYRRPRRRPSTSKGEEKNRRLSIAGGGEEEDRRLSIAPVASPPMGEEPRTTTVALANLLGPESPFASLDVVIRSSLPPRTTKSGARKPPPSSNATLVVAPKRKKPTTATTSSEEEQEERRRLETRSKTNEIYPSLSSIDPDGSQLPASGSIPLSVGKPLAYAARPLLGDVYKGGKCAMLVDLEVIPPLPATTNKKKKKKQSSSSPSPSSSPEEQLEGAEKVIGMVSGCGVDGARVSATANRVDWDLAKRAALGYSLLMTSTCVVQIGLLFRQLHFSRTQAVAARVSLLCVAAQSLIDAVLCVANLLLCAVVQILFAAFAAVAFFELIIFCVVEMRYVVVVFQAHDPQRFWMQASTRRQLAVLHAQFYFALFASLCAVYAARDDVRPVVLAAYAFWIPQIVRNARNEHSEPFHDAYLYGMAATRLVPPLYVYAYPYSLVSVIVKNNKLRPGFCVLLVLFQAAQVAFLKAQQKLGPRFFVPRCFLPARYDYRRPLPPVTAAQGGGANHRGGGPDEQSVGSSPSSAGSGSGSGRSPENAADARHHRDTVVRRVVSQDQLGGFSFVGGSSNLDNNNATSTTATLGRSASADTESGTASGDDNDASASRERGFECSICFQFVLPSNRDHFITPCDHVRTL